jgi:hypothetical protein
MNENINKLANKAFDIMNILLDSFVVICNSKVGFDNIINEELNFEMHYDIVEELPNKNEIISILKEVKTFMTIENFSELENYRENTIFNKFLNLTLKSVKIYEKLSQNFYGQIIILHSDFSSNNVLKTKSTKPIHIFNELIEGVTCRLRSDRENSLSDNILKEILESTVMTTIFLMFDLNHIELNEQLSNFDLVKFNRIYLPVDDKNYLNVVITENRLSSLIQFLLGDINMSKEDSIKIISKMFTQLYESITEKNSKELENKEYKSDYNTKTRRKIINNLEQNLSILANLFSSMSNFKILTPPEGTNNLETLQTIKLPNARKIYQKLEIIYKFYEFYSTQNYGYNLPFTTSNNSNLNSNQSAYAFAMKYNIHDFEKLLNWKKFRIYLSKSDNLISRTSLFDLDSAMKIIPEENLINSGFDISLLTDSLGYMKKFTHLNTESSQQFFNQMMNESLLLNKFANISYSVTSTVIHKFSVYSSFEYYNKQMINLSYRNVLNLKYEIEFIKNKNDMKDINTGMSRTKSSGIIVPLLRTKKKINSKFNTFVYKPKYDKMPKPILNTSAASAASSNIYHK